MKHLKKLAAAVAALVLALCMGTTAFAAGPGSITINDAVEGQTYEVYQILDLESYSASTNAYSYKATAEWEGFINSAEINDKFVSVDDQGYVTWKNGASVADFAKRAKAYAEENELAPSADPVKATSSTVVFKDLDLGYYLVDTTLGTICSLDTTNPTVVMEEKNEVPSANKEVQEDSNNAWGDTNDVDLGQTVNYQVKIDVKAGAENYILHDTMSAGLTFNPESVKVFVNEAQISSGFEIVTAGLTDDCTFEVKFNNSILNAGETILVTYSATLNENAQVALPGNENKIKLQYGDINYPSYTPEDTTKTYTWDMDILKYANGDERKPLAGAEFILLNKDKKQAANIVEGKFAGWVAIEEATKLTTGENGKIEIDGLDSDTYYLRETAAPAGYNKLADDVEVVITGATEEVTYSTVVAKVNNKSGAELPSTGGMGTTLFYVLGAILVLGAGVALVVKRRMAVSK